MANHAARDEERAARGERERGRGKSGRIRFAKSEMCSQEDEEGRRRETEASERARRCVGDRRRSQTSEAAGRESLLPFPLSRCSDSRDAQPVIFAVFVGIHWHPITRPCLSIPSLSVSLSPPLLLSFVSLSACKHRQKQCVVQTCRYFPANHRSRDAVCCTVERNSIADDC